MKLKVISIALICVFSLNAGAELLKGDPNHSIYFKRCQQEGGAAEGGRACKRFGDLVIYNGKVMDCNREIDGFMFLSDADPKAVPVCIEAMKMLKDGLVSTEEEE